MGRARRHGMFADPPVDRLADAGEWRCGESGCRGTGEPLDRRPEADGEPADREAEGIEEAGPETAGRGSGDDDDEDQVLPSLRWAPAVDGLLLAAAAHQPPRDLAHRSKGAHPSAEEPSQQQSEQNRDEAERHHARERAGAEPGRQSDEGIDIEKDPDGGTELILSRAEGPDQEIEEEKKEAELNGIRRRRSISEPQSSSVTIAAPRIDLHSRRFWGAPCP